MGANLLRNGGFETHWEEERSHHCHIFPVGEGEYFADLGNIFVPPGWTFWFQHRGENPAQPEGGDIGSEGDPRRVHSGRRAYKYFTFHRTHHAGLYQQVRVTPGSRLRLTAWAHAWSNHKDDRQPDKFPHPDDGRWSEGPGYEAGFKLEGETDDDAWRNFTFYLGLDPTGGTNPFADTVIWGQGAHIYNRYAQVPPVEAVAQGETVTVFLRSKTLWPFKHNDAYWDDVQLAVVEEEEEGGEAAGERGKPRVQYERTYVLLPPGADVEWALAAVDGSWERRYTIGSSADDAGIGDLDRRRVIAVNPGVWPSDLQAFFEQYYPGVEYVPLEAASPDELRRRLSEM